MVTCFKALYFGVGTVENRDKSQTLQAPLDTESKA